MKKQPAPLTIKELAEEMEAAFFADQDRFIKKAIKGLRDDCHADAERAGWWRHDKSDLREVINEPATPFEKVLGGALVAQKLCLIHGEISEAMEGHRKGLMDDHLPGRSMLEVELADALIRIFDLAGAMKLDLGGAMAEKMAYNRQRADHKPEARMAAGGKAY